MARKDVIRRFEVRISDERVALVLDELKKDWFPSAEYADNKVINRLIREIPSSQQRMQQLEEKNKELELQVQKLKDAKKEDEKAWFEQKMNYEKLLSKAINLERERMTFLKNAQDMLKF